MTTHCFQLPRRLILTLTLLTSFAPASAEESILLKPKFDMPNDAYVEFTTDVAQTMPGPDGKPMEVLARSVYGLLTKAASKGDTVAVEATFDRLFGTFTFRSGGNDGIKSIYDTDDPESEDASPDHAAAFGPILNAPLKISLDGKGIATGVDGGDAIRRKLAVLGEQNFVAKSLADEDFSDRQIMSSFGETPLVLFPYREVKVGETWEKTRQDEYPHVGKVSVKYECTLERIDKSGDDASAIVRFKGTIAKDPAEQPAPDKRLGKIDGSFTGTARFSAARGRFVEMQNEMKAQIEIPPFWTKEAGAPLTKIEGQFKHSLAVSAAADRLKRKDEIGKQIAEVRAKREAEEAAASAGPVDPVTPANTPVAWLQWGGPSRNFASDATGLANRWPKGGPPKLWERPLGDGFSGILCNGDALFTMYSIREKEDATKGEDVVAALDARTGKTLWEHKYAAPWPKDLQMDFGPGPHSTPTLVGDRLFTVGCTAQLHCLQSKTGKVIWSKDLLGEFKAAMNMYGYGSSPLAYKGNIILPVSAEKGHAVMAFAQSDGAVAWKGNDFEPGYASLFPIDIHGVEQLVAFTGKSVCGLEPTSGNTLAVTHIFSSVSSTGDD